MIAVTFAVSGDLLGCLSSQVCPSLSLPQSLVHCKNIWVTSTIFWSSQLNACCVCDTLQTSKDASSLIQSLSIVKKLLLFVKLESCRKPSYLAAFLAFLP